MKINELQSFLKDNAIKIIFDGTAYGYNVIVTVPLDKVKDFTLFVGEFTSIRRPLQTILETEGMSFEITPLLEFYKINPNDL